MTHWGGCDRFFLTASSAISSILSSDVSPINFDAAATFSLLGHLSPKTQPLMQASAQLISASTVTSFLTLLATGKSIFSAY